MLFQYYLFLLILQDKVHLSRLNPSCGHSYFIDQERARQFWNGFPLTNHRSLNLILWVI